MHNESLGDTVIGKGLITRTVMVSLLMQPKLFVPVTIYCIESVGVAVGAAQSVQLNAVAGVHAYCVAPVTVNCTDEPKQSSTLFFATSVGLGLMVTW